MKIALTGDVHLRGKDEYPERFRALENIYSQAREKGINQVIIAGDLFDAESQNYKDFDNLLKEYEDIGTHVIPGNHDHGIRQNLFAAQNLTVYSEPALVEMDSLQILFLPYHPDKSMGEMIASQKDQLDKNWLLIGHGDYLGSRRETNPYEPGTYMPLNRDDINRYQPGKVILGHIHRYYNTGKLFYTGSPCGMDINETGKRRFLSLDTDTLSITGHTVETDYIYFNESLMVLPLPNEWEYVRQQIRDIIQKWNLSEKDKEKTVIRITGRGYTTNKQELHDLILKEFGDYRFYNDEGPELDRVNVAEDPELMNFIEQVKQRIYDLNWDEEKNFTTKEDILEEALKLILK